ncbi:hypothetical protein GUJ93_ZPchr0004g38735 [Zizania palustris]|uniref:Uncharacterized protein n=1 Tax=Zizania palustris TaxID=103762 RepID=A0A8J5SP82_ZIZPA|nr:hypothetical protein GUJ93_ZPchr0004g38735 [Zizania palustris]
MRFRKTAAADAEDAAAAGGGDGGSPGDDAGASPYHDITPNGSKDEWFFEAKPWLDSDSEDDFHSVRGDFTPSRGTTPDHQRQSPFTRLEPSLNEKKKQRLLELLQEKQQYDDDSITDVVHAEEYLKSSRKGAKVKKSSSEVCCFPSSICKINFRSCRKKRREQEAKLKRT